MILLSYQIIMTEVKKIAQNTMIQIVGKALTIVFALIGFGLMTRYLGQEGYGYFVTIYTFLAIFGILVDLGLQMTTTQLISDPNEDESKILSNALTIRLVTSLIFLGLAPIIALAFPYPTIIKVGIAFATIGFIFHSLISTLTSLFQKKLIMHKTVIADVSSRIIYIGLIIIAIKFNSGLLGIIGAVIFDSIIAFIILFYFAKKILPLKLSFDVEVWKKILIKTWPIALTIALNLIYFKGDIFIMSLIRTQAEVGLYGAPYKILEVLINVIYLFLGLILPILSTAVAIKNFDKLKIIIQSAFDFIIILTMPMIVGGYFLGKELMIIMAGPEFAISGDIIKILFLATGAIFLAALFGYVVVALDQQKKMIKFYAINAVLSIAGYWYFISNYGYWGAAWMTVFTELFILITAAYVMKQSLKFFPKPKLLIKSIAATAVMSIPLYLLPNLHFAFAVTMGGLVYFTALYIFKGFDKQAVLEIIKTKKDETTDNQ